MSKPTKRAIAAALLALIPTTVAAAAPAETRTNAESRARIATLQSKASEAEGKINQSAEARAAFAAANPDQARALLLRYGFTADQLEGVAVRMVKAPSPSAAAARIKGITIKVSCCPPEIVITIRF